MSSMCPLNKWNVHHNGAQTYQQQKFDMRVTKLDLVEHGKKKIKAYFISLEYFQTIHCKFD